MIRVRIELVPHGDEKSAREIASLRIANVSTTDTPADAPCEYEVEAVEQAFGTTEEKRTFAGFAHVRGAGVLACVAAALRAIGKDNG